MNILKKTFAIRKAFDYISAPRQTELVWRDTVKCPSGLRSTPGKCVYKKLYREFESLLHRHILQTQTPGFLTRAGGLWFLAFLNTGLDTVRCAQPRLRHRLFTIIPRI